MTGTQLLSSSVKSRSAKQRIASFRQRFGEGHFYLACHAAMPIALTPDLLYSLWANFQRDTHGDAIEIPWIAVADLMLSNLCQEVGQELYEIDQEIQNELLNQLQQDSRLGLERIRELADFVTAYVEQQLDSPDLDVRDLAQGQQWRALAYKNPSEAARSIATVLAQLPLNDKSEWIRINALVGSLAEPLSAYQSLLNYIRAIASLARGNLDATIAQMSKAVDANNQVRVEGINLPIPDILHRRLPDLTEQDVPPVLPRNKFVLSIAITGGAIVSLLVFLGIQNGLQSPNSKQSPNITKKNEALQQEVVNTPEEIAKLLLSYGFTPSTSSLATNIGRRQSVIVQYSPKDVDPEVVQSTLQKLGFNVQVVKANVSNIPTNAIWFGAKVSIEDVKVVAYALISAGIQIKTIKPFRGSSDEPRASLIQVGADGDYVDKPNLSVSEIHNAKEFVRSE